MTENSGRVTTREHYNAIMELRKEGEERERRIMGAIGTGFKDLKDDVCGRMDKQDDRIDNVVNWEKIIGIIAVVWPAGATLLASCGG